MSGSGVLRRLLSLLVVAVLVAAFFASGLERYLSLGALRDHDLALHAFVANNPLLAAAVFVAIYALVVGLSLPGGAVMTVSSGFLFGLWTGSLLSVVGATAGAIILFLVARLVAGDALRARAGPFLKTHGRRLQAECVFLPAFTAASAAISLLGGQSCSGLAGRTAALVRNGHADRRHSRRIGLCLGRRGTGSVLRD